MRMCCPLSSGTPSISTRRARPPRWREASKTVTRAPRSASATPAASPAQPAPTTATRAFIGTKLSVMRAATRSGGDPGLPRNPQLAQRRERDALREHVEAVAADLVQQRAVDRRHHQARPLRLAVFTRQRGVGVGVALL